MSVTVSFPGRGDFVQLRPEARIHLARVAFEDLLLCPPQAEEVASM